MKVFTIVCRVLLGFMFTVFGLNGFLHFIPQPPPKAPLALQYMTVLTASHIFAFVFVVEVVAGILLLTGTSSAGAGEHRALPQPPGSGRIASCVLRQSFVGTSLRPFPLRIS